MHSLQSCFSPLVPLEVTYQKVSIHTLYYYYCKVIYYQGHGSHAAYSKYPWAFCCHINNTMVSITGTLTAGHTGTLKQCCQWQKFGNRFGASRQKEERAVWTWITGGLGVWGGLPVQVQPQQCGTGLAVSTAEGGGGGGGFTLDLPLRVGDPGVRKGSRGCLQITAQSQGTVSLTTHSWVITIQQPCRGAAPLLRQHIPNTHLMAYKELCTADNTCQ